MPIRSVTRELALLVLSQIPESQLHTLTSSSLSSLLNKALDSLMQHWREQLDATAIGLESAQQDLLDSELQNSDSSSLSRVRDHLAASLNSSEKVLNSLSACLELPKLIVLGDQEEIRLASITRVDLVLQESHKIDSQLDAVMEGWRLKRLPRIDRDILRLSVVDLMFLQTPVAVACNEAVELANRYSDEQGRRMINGVLRRLQDASFAEIS